MAVASPTNYHHSGDAGREQTYRSTAESARIQSLPKGAYEKGESRKVSTVVIGEEYLSALPEATTRYVEIPKVEVVKKFVHKKEIREVERIVPKYIDKFYEREVEVPRYIEIEKEVERIVPREVIKTVPRYVYHKVPKPQMRDVSVEKRNARAIEGTVDGGVIEVPRPVRVHQKVAVTEYQTIDQKLIVAQTVKPVIIEGEGEVVVDVTTYEPEVIPVDIHVAKFVDTELVQVGETRIKHRVVSVPPAQYNSMLRYLNKHLTDEERQLLPYVEASGRVEFLSNTTEWKAPYEDTQIEGLAAGMRYFTHGTVTQSGLVSNMEQIEAQRRHSELQFNQTMRELEDRKRQKMMEIEEFNRSEKVRVEQEVHSLNRMFEEEFRLELARLERENIDNEHAAMAAR